MRSVILAALLVAALPALAHAQGTSGLESDQLPISFALNTHPHTLQAGMPAAGGGGVIGRRSSGSLLGIDSVTNWSSYFYYPGVDSNGFPQFTWEYTMVGNSPFSSGQNGQWGGQTTRLGAPVVAVNLDLRNADGSPRFVGGQRLYYDATQFVKPVLSSPVFSNTFYSSSDVPTQFTDALMRAEFFHSADDDWHTLLKPRVATARTMVLIRGTYRFALNNDGSCCAYVLIDYGTFVNALFPATATDTTTPIGAAENAGDITTKDISTFLFPNAYLYFNGNPSDCCVLGFHSYDLEPGGPNNGFQERRYVMNYSSWTTPGLFGTAFADITALSHEMSETFNDPFGGNATPWWLAPNGNCQNNLETGDVIEGLPNAVYPISLNGSTWSPQNEGLLQWFAGQTPSSAIHHAYSYPDTSVLPAASVSQNAGCTPPLP
ncbi:MAG: hypothetical protein WB543_15985 [Candidatus Acidiferrum sp.]